MSTEAEKATICRRAAHATADEIVRSAFVEAAEYFEARDTDGERCQECGGPVGLVWWCHDDFLWEAVTGHRRTGRENAAGVLCIDCFDTKAKEVCPWIEWAPANLRHLLSPEVSGRIAEERHG